MKRILVVDDDPAACIMLKALLRSDNLAIETATEGAVALQLLAQRDYDLMVLDMNMQPLDGLQIMQRMRQMGIATPVVILTSETSLDKAVQALRTGALNYLFKSTDPESLRQQILGSLQQAGSRATPPRSPQPASTGTSLPASALPAEWFRLRYDAQGQSLRAAQLHLDSLARSGQLRILWVVSRQNIAIMVSTDPEREALLVEGLHNSLPGARLVRERVDGFLGDLPNRYYIHGGAPGPSRLPEALAQLGSDAAMRLEWKRGMLSPPCLMTREGLDKVRQVLRNTWPGIKLLGFPLPLYRTSNLPSGMFELPSSAQHPTLASRNTQELAFSRVHAGNLVLGADRDGRAVGVSHPARVIWVGAPSRVDNGLAGLSQHWRGQIVVLGAVSSLQSGWQDIGRARVFVDWDTPGRSTRINPLARLPGDNDASYINRCVAWLTALRITRQVIGTRAMSLLTATLRLLAATEVEINPANVLAFLSAPESVTSKVADLAAQVLPEEEFALWQTRDWKRDMAGLAPALAILRSLFDRVPEMVLWLPPYASAETLSQSPWVIVRVPSGERSQRIYWAGMWPLFRAAFARPDVLALALGLKEGGKNALGLFEGGASVIAWGASLPEAIGEQMVSDNLNADLIVGAETNPAPFAPVLRVPARILSAQAPDQAIARLDGDVGSLRLCLPQKHPVRQTGWNTPSGGSIPTPASVMGAESAARMVVLAAIRHAILAGRKVLVLGNRDLWDELIEFNAVTLPANELPMLNPLERVDDQDVFRWTWWGSGLKLKPAILQGAYHAGVATLQGLCAYLADTPDGEVAAAIVTDALKTGAFGVSETDPRSWFARSPNGVLAVESFHPAIARYLAAIALDVQASLILWHASGIMASDCSLLARTSGIIYPDAIWVPTVLVTRALDSQALATLPERVREAAGTLGNGEVLVYKRGQGEYFKVALE